MTLITTQKKANTITTTLQYSIYMIACVCIAYATCAYMYDMTTSIVCTIVIAIMEIEKNILLRHAIIRYSSPRGLGKYGWFCVVSYSIFSIASMWGVYNYVLSKMPVKATVAPVAPTPPAPEQPQHTQQSIQHQQQQDDYMAALVARTRDMTATPMYRAVARQRLDSYMAAKMERDIEMTKKTAEQQLENARARTALYAAELAEYKKKYASFENAQQNAIAKSGLTSLLLELITSISCVIFASQAAAAVTTPATIAMTPVPQPTPRPTTKRKTRNTPRRTPSNVIRLSSDDASPVDYTQMSIRKIMGLLRCGPERATRIQRGLEVNPVRITKKQAHTVH